MENTGNEHCVRAGLGRKESKLHESNVWLCCNNLVGVLCINKKKFKLIKNTKTNEYMKTPGLLSVSPFYITLRFFEIIKQEGTSYKETLPEDLDK